MALQSQLFRGDSKLEAAATSDPAHIVQGANGDHVRKIQQALIQLDSAAIKADGSYGPGTAAAVLAYKQKRNIVNAGYQTKPDNIVGKMTMAALDREMLLKENELPSPKTCILLLGCPCDRPNQSASGASFVSSLSASVTGARASDADLMAAALKASRSTLRSAQDKISDLAFVIELDRPLSAKHTRTFASAAKWLNLSTSNPKAAVPHLKKAVQLMLANLNVTTSAGAAVPLTRVVGDFHGLTNLRSPDLGLRCGNLFFTSDGPNCRRDVVTHEFFHFVGVTHGGGTLLGPTIRSAITTPAQALDSADNLAQLVAELETPSGKTDACARAGE